MGEIKHLYFYAQDLALTLAQRNTLLTQLKALMANPNDPQPARRNHWRPNVAGDCMVFEAALDVDHLTPLSIRNRLATIAGVQASNITYTTAATVYGSVVTFKVGTTNRLRLGVFGPDGLAGEWGASLEACKSYLKANAAAWEPQEVA